MDLVRSWWLLCLALGATVACANSHSGRGRLVLEAKLPVSFQQLSNVIELHDGRIAFAETRERLFLRGDLRTGKLDTIGTRVDTVSPGAAPSVYKLPGWVAHLAGDTIALVDFAALRTTLWTEAGQPVKTLSLPPVGGATPVLAYDQSGFGYKADYQAIVGGGEPGRTLRPDSVAILRFELASGRVDTVASLAAPEYGDAVFGEQTQEVAKIFGPNDAFGVLPDGRVWVARARENRVDWRGPGGVWIRGRPRDYTKVPVTEADKQRVIARIREQGKGRGLPDTLRLEWPFAENKPPFEAGSTSPAGDVWLQQARPLDAPEAVYDVYGPNGAWKDAVTFPSGVTLAGFGSGGAVYGIIKDGEKKTVGKYKLQ
jgi:hypothetical protein